MGKLWSEVSKELQRRQEILVLRSHDSSFSMDPQERRRIQSVLELEEVPQKPIDIPGLLKQFCVSAYSYAPLRNNFLSPLLGSLPSRDNIAKALSLAFNRQEFLNDCYWSPERLGALASNIQAERKFNLSSKKFPCRVIAVLLTGTQKFRDELCTGLDDFYEQISQITDPSAMWAFVHDFAKQIDQVGSALICDFLKEIGFVRYVKVDHHFGRQFPALINLGDSCRLSPKKSFILSQEIADAVGMTPYHLDAILYLWGRYGDKYA